MAFTVQGQPNVTVFVSSLGGYEEARQKTVRQFRDMGIKINVASMTHELVERLAAEGFTALPVIKLEREGESWQDTSRIASPPTSPSSVSPICGSTPPVVPSWVSGADDQTPSPRSPHRLRAAIAVYIAARPRGSKATVLCGFAKFNRMIPSFEIVQRVFEEARRRRAS